jgi:hypothetical protein
MRPASGAGENIVLDPMFLQGEARSVAFGSAFYVDDGAQRYFNVYYNTVGGFYANNNTPVPVTLGAGQKLYFAAMIYHSDRTSGYGFIKAECYNVAGTPIGIVSVSAQPSVFNTWAEVTGSVVCPADTAMVRTFFERSPANLGGDSASVAVRRLYCGGRPA